jgi:hypothetical protein
MRLKKQRARWHPGCMNDNVAIGVRADLDCGDPQRKRANAAPGAAQTKRIIDDHAADIDRCRRRLRRHA